MFEKKPINMKKILTYVSLAIFTVSTSGCDVLNEFAEGIPSTTGETSKALTNGEVITGLKEALSVGIKNSVDLTSVTDGFLGNAEIKLPFPPDALKVKEKAEQWGLDGQVDKIITTLNRAAEDAATEAGPIFLDAIKNMSVQDGFSILNGGEGAATTFLKDKTTAQLVTAFSPKVAASIEKVKLTDYWEPVIKRYNQAMALTGGETINPDLNQYVTERAVAGLFTMVEKEENKIRKDPVARVTDILQKVFGSLDN